MCLTRKFATMFLYRQLRILFAAAAVSLNDNELFTD